MPVRLRLSPLVTDDEEELYEELAERWGVDPEDVEALQEALDFDLSLSVLNVSPGAITYQTGGAMRLMGYVAIALELSMVGVFIYHKSTFGLVLAVCYAWFSATWAGLFRSHYDDTND